VRFLSEANTGVVTLLIPGISAAFYSVYLVFLSYIMSMIRIRMIV
jgi:hypothetical protein